MLTESAYHIALYTYIGAALAIVLFLGWRLSRHTGPGTVALLTLLAAALLLTPAYPRAGVLTLAPALIVAAFQWLTQGADSAMHALRPLGLAVAAAVVLAALLKITVLRRARTRPAAAERPARKDAGGADRRSRSAG